MKVLGHLQDQLRYYSAELWQELLFTTTEKQSVSISLSDISIKINILYLKS